MRPPKGRPFKVILAVNKEFTAIIQDIENAGFSGYLHSFVKSNGQTSEGYIIFQSGNPIIASHSHMKEVNSEAVVDQIIREIESKGSKVELRELSQREIELYLRYMQYLDIPGVDRVLKVHRPVLSTQGLEAEEKGEAIDAAEIQIEEELEDYLRQVEMDFSDQAADRVLKSIGLSHMKQKKR